MFKARDYQREAIDALYRYFETSNGNPLLVLPTAAGKGVILALFLKEVLEAWPDQRILILTHVKELIEQNYLKLKHAWSEAPAGINSAGVGRRDTDTPILFAGIQSVWKKGLEFDPFNLVVIDEAHLCSRKNGSMYQRFLHDIRLNNPAVKIIGLTATHYRLDSGLLTEGADRLFTDIAYELPVKRLIKAGYLAPLITKGGVEKADLSGVHTRGGDYIDSEAADAFAAILDSAIGEIVAYGKNRRSWLIFTHNVESAQGVARRLLALGVTAACLHGGTPKPEREQMIRGYKSGAIKTLVNCQVLTTGFDAPETDLLVLLRATKSTALFVQICGRAMRTAPGKANALVLDYGGNVERHGPIDSIEVKTRRASNGEAETEVKGAPTRTCPECETIVDIWTRVCPDCGYQWPAIAPDIFAQASDAAILSDQIKPQRVEIRDVQFGIHQKEGRPDSIRIYYYDDLGYLASEWVCPEHGGFARQKALKMIHKLLAEPADFDDLYELGVFNSTADFLNHLTQYPTLWRWPTAVTVRRQGKFFEVLDHEFESSTTDRTERPSQNDRNNARPG